MWIYVCMQIGNMAMLNCNADACLYTLYCHTAIILSIYVHTVLLTKLIFCGKPHYALCQLLNCEIYRHVAIAIIKVVF